MRKIGWLDSAGFPSHTHLTEDGIDTLCKDHADYIQNRTLIKTPKKVSGFSNFCRVCFKKGGKNLQWDVRCR